METVLYRLDEHIAWMTLNDGENRFNPTFLQAVLDTLDDIEQQTEATTLVVNSADEKIFCNGIDLAWLAPVIQKNDLATAKRFFFQLNRVFKRLVNYPLVTIAAINGHAFAGGAILSCAFDLRFMRSDRGYFCLPEVDLGMPFLPGMNALLRKVISEPCLHEMQLTGARLTAEQCVAKGIVHQACPQEALMETAMVFAKSLHKHRKVVAELKARLNRAIIQAMDVEDVAYIESGRFNISINA